MTKTISDENNIDTTYYTGTTFGGSGSCCRPGNRAAAAETSERWEVISAVWQDVRGGWELFCGLAESGAHLPKLCFIGFLFGALSGLLIPQSRSLDELNDLKKASVLLTGASNGVGEHLAYIFASKGARLFLTSKSEKNLKTVAANCERFGAASVYYQVADMTNSSSIDDVTKIAVDKFNNRLDFLVLNHVLLQKQPLTTHWRGNSQDLLADLHLFMEVNFISYAHLASALMPSLKLSRGRIVVVSSVMGRHSYPHFLAHSASKAALDSFFAGIRQELDSSRPEKVSVTLAVLGTPCCKTTTPGSPQGKRIIDISNVFAQDSNNETAKCVIFGAHDRSREVFCPNWLQYPFSFALNVPFFRPILQKIISYYNYS